VTNPGRSSVGWKIDMSNSRFISGHPESGTSSCPYSCSLKLTAGSTISHPEAQDILSPLFLLVEAYCEFMQDKQKEAVL
jgi:hypothetical protein